MLHVCRDDLRRVVVVCVGVFVEVPTDVMLCNSVRMEGGGAHGHTGRLGQEHMSW